MPASSSRSSIPCSATSKPGSSALITASAPSTCRAIFGNGPTGSTAAICPMGWTATSFGAPSNAPPSPTISSRPAPCQAALTVSGGLPQRLRNLLQPDRDVAQLPNLLHTTAQNFTVRQVSADAVYNSKRNQEEIAAIGAEAFIPFKSNHTGKLGGLWGEKLRQFHEKPEYFSKHYHQRSNI